MVDEIEDAKYKAGELKQAMEEAYKAVCNFKHGLLAMEQELDDQCTAVLGRKLDDLYDDYRKKKKLESQVSVKREEK